MRATAPRPHTRPARVVMSRASSPSDVDGERWLNAVCAVTPRRGPDPLHSPHPHYSAAWTRLLAFTAADKAGRSRPLLTEASARASLASALWLAASSPRLSAGWDPATRPRRLLLAVLAPSETLAARALRDYGALFGVAYVPPQPRVENGAVFVKLNAACDAPPPVPRAVPYSGPDRGVLVTLGDVQVGHLPLGLLDEGREGPAPPLAGE